MSGARRTRSRAASLRLVGLVLAAFVAFVAFVALSWEARAIGGVSFFYPAAGVTAAAMILSRRTVWPWIAVSVVAAELLADIHYGAQTRVSIAFAIANIVQSAIGAAVVRTCCAGRPDLRRRRDFAAFVAGPRAIGPGFGAPVGGTPGTTRSAYW